MLGGEQDVLTTTLARVEFGSAIRRARDAGRLAPWQETLDRFDLDCSDGPVTLLGLHGGTTARAYTLVLEHALRALDAIHLAVALEESVKAFVTRDTRQAAAAASLGLAVL